MTREEFEILLKVKTDPTGMNSLSQAMSGIKSGMAQLIGATGGFGAILGGLSFGAVISGMTRVTETASQLSAQIERTRATIGTTAEEFQVFSGTLKDANQSGDEFIGAISRIQKTIGEASAGSKEARQAFERIGLSFQQLRSMSAGQQLEAVAVGLDRIKNESDRAAASNAILGKSYADLRALLDGLARKGFAGLRAEQAATRGILSDEYSKALDDAKTRTEAAAERMAKALTPVRIAWEKIKSEAQNTLAQIADPSVRPLENQVSVLDKLIARREILAKQSDATSVAALRLIEEAIAKAKAELPTQTYIGSPRTGGRSPSGGRDWIKAQAAEAKRQQDASDKAKKAEIDLDFALAEARRKAIQQSIEQGNALFLEAQKAEAVRKEKEARLSVELEQFALNQRLAESRGRVSAIESNPFFTNLQKNREVSKELQNQNILIEERISALQRQAALEQDPAAKFQIGQEIGSLQAEQQRNIGDISNRAPTTIFQDFADGLKQLQNGFVTVGQTIANTIGAAMDSVTNQLTRAILYTGDFASALRNVGVVILEEVIRSIIRMGVQWVIQKTLIAGVDAKLRLAALGQNIAAAAAQSAIWIGPATLATIASFGAAAAQAPAAIAAAKLAAAPMAAFEYGGDTGNGPRSGGIDGKGGFLAVMHPQETVIDRYHGTIGDMRIDTPRSPSMSDPGETHSIINGSAGAGQTNVIVGIHDDRHRVESFFNTNRGERVFLDLGKKLGFARR